MGIWRGAVPWNFSFSTPSLHWFFTTLFPKQTRPCRSWRSQDMAEDSYVLEVSNQKTVGNAQISLGRKGSGLHFHDFKRHLFLEHGGKFGVNFCAWNLTWLRYRVQIWDPWLLLVTIRHVDSVDQKLVFLALAILGLWGFPHLGSTPTFHGRKRLQSY